MAPGRERVILFGGRYREASQWRTLRDTWEWDGSDWSETTPDDVPEGRSFGAMAFDPERERAVLFGGESGGNITLSDTWEYLSKKSHYGCAASPSAWAGLLVLVVLRRRRRFS